MIKLGFGAITAVILIYAGISVLLYFGQRKLLYFPTPEIRRALAPVIWLDSAANKLKIWHLPGTGPDAIIYFGGNAEDVSLNIPDFSVMFPAYSVYLVNYRGYGGSAGSPSETALFQDALAVYDHVRATHPGVSVIGRSLGSGVAVYLASMREIQRLVLVTPYDSIAKLAKRNFPIFPISLLLKDRFESMEHAARITSPTLVVIAEHDEVIPRESSEALVSGFQVSTVEKILIQNASHNSVSDSPAYNQALRRFF